MQVHERLKDLLRPTGEEDLMRVRYPRPRWQITPWQGAACAAVLLAVMALWWAWPRPSVESTAAVSAADLVTTVPAPLAEETTASEAPREREIVVSVVGRIERPGLIRLPPGSRVADALDAAVPHGDANTLVLNLARRLNDGEQIHVPGPGEDVAQAPGVVGAPEPGGGVGGAGGAGTVSLNSASVQELMELDGVGEVTARAIVDYRESHGGFSEVDQLQEVRGIGPAKFAALKDRVVP
ncbi:ComEA family DNA-binding protein [Corynebacterium mastitidis]|uniref:ComEA family DNA-binding protein n=1 Tax=Corynebacterium mastitidis TaxID=161890 RepID=A0ABU8P092_9CORY